MPTTTRIFNFSAGPAVLPVPVLEQAQRDLVCAAGCRHVGDGDQPSVEGVRGSACTAPSPDFVSWRACLRTTEVLLLQGGASLQFSMVPMNLLKAGTTADYVDTGTWAVKAIKEARRVGTVNVTGSTKADKYTRIPAQSELTLTPGASYVHITSNNTIEGTEWKAVPDVGGVPLVADASSDILSGPIDVSRFGVIYAGAQKNLGPSGVTLVIIREDLLEQSDKNLPTMLSYKVQAENNSLYNTPNTFGVYIFGLVMQWLKSLGGLAGDRPVESAQGGDAVLGNRSDRLLSRHRSGREPFTDEHHVPPAERGTGKDVRQAGLRSWIRRPQRASIGRRPAGLDLQRVSGRGCGGARGFHARVRAHARLARRRSERSPSTPAPASRAREFLLRLPARST